MLVVYVLLQYNGKSISVYIVSVSVIKTKNTEITTYLYQHYEICCLNITKLFSIITNASSYSHNKAIVIVYIIIFFFLVTIIIYLPKPSKDLLYNFIKVILYYYYFINILPLC